MCNYNEFWIGYYCIPSYIMIMFPWSLEEWKKVLGFPSGVECIAEKTGLDKNTIRAFIGQKHRLRSSTIKHAKLDSVQQILDQTSLKVGEDEGEIRVYSGFFRFILTLSDEASATGLILPRGVEDIVFSFPHTVYAILWTESVYLDACEGKRDRSVLFSTEGPFSSFPVGMAESQPSEAFDYSKDLYNLHLHHALMFFLASLDTDIEINPERFFPKKTGGELRRPMFFFVESLKQLAEAKSWVELAEKADSCQKWKCEDTAFQIRRWANTPTLEHCWSWVRLKQFLDCLGVEPLTYPEEGVDQQRAKILRDYALARILQEHFQRIHSSLERAGITDEQLHSFYTKCFNLCKENECKRIP